MLITEGELVFDFTRALRGSKFDDPKTHGVDGMKAVDFLVEFEDFILFVEVKEPDASKATDSKRREFLKKLESTELERASTSSETLYFISGPSRSRTNPFGTSYF